jgi:NADPH:quinone reductase-like Zn-dependent oxidoreductase
MKAVFFAEHGGIDKLTWGDFPTPVPGPGETRVRVKACALNRLDLLLRQGTPGLAVPLPHVLGADVAGTTDDGRRVLIAPGLSCGACPACATGRDHLCDRFDILGQNTNGGYAEFVVVPERNLLPLPETIPFEVAAAFPLVFTTAWHALVSLAGLTRGETALIHAGGSGVGTAAIQIARERGARVMTTVGAPWKKERAIALGAEQAVVRTEEDWATAAARWTEGRGVDVVLDTVGQTTFATNLQCLRKGGRLVACGSTSGREASFDLRSLFGKNITVFGTRLGPRRALEDVFALFKTGRFKPVVDRAFPLDQAAAAQAHLQENKSFGKVVLTIA